jgi:hypothetical protein
MLYWAQCQDVSLYPGTDYLISHQAFELDNLIATYMEEVGAIGPLSDAVLEQLDRHRHAISGRFAVRLDKVHEFLAGLAAFVESTIEEANESERTQLLLDMELMFVVACNRISDIAVNRDAVNERSPEQSLTPVLPHDLVKISAAEFLR